MMKLMAQTTFMLTLLAILGCAESTQTASVPESPETVTANKVPASEAAPAQDLSAEEERLDQPSGTESTPAERVEAKIDEATDAAVDWVFDTREALMESADQRLAQVRQELEEMKTRTADLSDQAKSRFEESQKKIDEELRQFSEQVETLRNSGETEWNELAKGLTQAWNELQESIKSARGAIESN